MEADPLTVPLDDWTTDHMRALTGRPESQRLELKSDRTDLRTRRGRALIAKEVAGMASSSGGYVVVGTDNGDKATSFPGIEISESDSGALRNSLWDTIRPGVLVRGPRIFDGDTPDRFVLVLEVLPDPRGLPTSANDTFYIRVGASTYPMGYEDVRRRFQLAGDTTQRATARAEALYPHECQAMAIEHAFKDPFGVTAVPMIAGVDLGLIGEALRSSVSQIREREETLWTRIEPDYWGPTGQPIRISHEGVSVMRKRIWSMRGWHDGSFAATRDLSMMLHGTERGTTSLRHIATTAARFAGFGIAFQRSIGVTGPVLLSLRSGAVTQVVLESDSVSRRATSMREPGSRVSYEAAVPIRGATVEALLSVIGLFVQRVQDGTDKPDLAPEFPEVEAYLVALLNG